MRIITKYIRTTGLHWRIFLFLLLIGALMAQQFGLAMVSADTETSITRDLPATVTAGQVFDVSLTFTAPSNDFNSIGIHEFAPSGWKVSVDKAWCTPPADQSNIVTDTREVQYLWYGGDGNYAEGTSFTAMYRVTVPDDVSAGVYNWDPGSNLVYYIAGDGPFTVSTVGDNQLTAVVPDNTPPIVESTSPADGAENVTLSSPVTVTFSEPMDAASVQEAFSISPEVAGGFSWNAAGNEMTFTPVAELDAETAYTIVIGAGAADRASPPNYLDSAFTFSFTTGAAAQYTLTVIINPEGSGTVSFDKTGPYDLNEVVRLTAVPAEGWHFSGWDGDLQGEDNPESITMDNDKAVVASFAQDIVTFTITASAGAGGVITPSGVVTVNSGADQAFTITPNSGYHIDNVLVDSVSQGAVASYTFENVTADHTISAVFAENPANQFTLTVEVNGNGNVAKNPEKPVYDAGEIVILTATPASGWSFTGWSGDHGGSDNPSMVNMDRSKTVTANFTQNPVTKYTITASAGAGGSISPSGSVEVSAGENQTFTITPNAGCHVTDVMVDNVSQGAISSYTFEEVSANHSITAAFEVNPVGQYTLAVNITGSGTVTREPNKASYDYGDSVLLTAQAGTGYTFDHWSGDLDGTSRETSYQINITMDRNREITATFVETTSLIITATAHTGGVIVPSGAVTVPLRGSQDFRIMPDPNYKIDTLKVDGVDVVGEPVPPAVVYTFHEVTSNRTIEVTFTPCEGPQVYEWYHTLENSTDLALYAVQTFTPRTNHIIQSFNLCLINETGSEITANGIIRAVDENGLPTGGPLATSTNTPVIPGNWTIITFNFGNDCELAAGTMYAFQINSSLEGVHSYVSTKCYDRGRYMNTNNIQDDCHWNIHEGNWDLWFEEYGVPVQSPTPTPPVYGGGGGGGGWAGPVLKSIVTTGLTCTGSLTVDANGFIQSQAELKTADGKLVLEVAKSTRLSLSNGSPLTSMIADILAGKQDSPERIVLWSVELGPIGAKFEPSITLTMRYDASELPPGASESDLYLAYLDGTQWVKLESRVDTQAKTVSAGINHFSRYAVIAPVLQPPPAVNRPVDLVVTPVSAVTAPQTTTAVTPVSQPAEEAPQAAAPAAAAEEPPAQTAAVSSPSPEPAPEKKTNFVLIGVIVAAFAVIAVVSGIIISRRRTI